MKITPLARRIASEAGVDLTKIRGTGVRGCVTKNDVYHAISATEVFQGNTTVADTIALLSGTANVTEFLSLLDSLQTPWYNRFSQPLKKSDLLIYIVACALAGMPEFLAHNVHENRDDLFKLALFHQEAKDIQVYDVKNIKQITLSDITAHLTSKPDAAFDGGWDVCSVVITDLSNYRVDWFIPTLFAPFAVSIGFAGIMPRPSRCDTRVCLLETLPVILRFAPQLIDYGLAGRILTRIIELLEQPSRLLSYQELA